MCYFVHNWPAIVQAVSAAAQVVTAIIIVVLTQRLVRATDTYASLTKAALDLSTKQYEDDLSPMWHLDLTAAPEQGVVWLRVLNLSKNSARVTHVLIRPEEDDRERKFVLDFGLPGLQQSMDDIAQFILQAVQPHIQDGEWDGDMEIAVVFHLGNESPPIPSSPFRFAVRIHEGRVASAKSKPPTFSVESRRENNQ